MHSPQPKGSCYLTPFASYCLMVALKNHFTIRSYDYFKYGGKISTNRSSFSRRSDQILFVKASNRYKAEELRDYIIANLASGNHSWMNMILDERSHDEYLKYLGINQSITYHFNASLEKINSACNKNIKSLLRPSNSGYPLIIDLYMAGDISPQSMTILDHIFQYSKTYDKFYGDSDPIWGKLSIRIPKLGSFIRYDRSKIIEIAKKNLLNNG